MKNHHVSRKARAFSVCFFLVIIGLWGTNIEAQEQYAYKYNVTSNGEDTLYYRCLQPERNTLWFCFYMVRENVEMTMKLN